MKIKNHLSLGRLIGKIDNDFNISESDWIPRVAAWVIDALSQMQILPMEKKKRTLEVSHQIAQFPCTLNTTELKVFDANGNEIPNIDDDKCKCPNASVSKCNTQEIGVFDASNKTGVNAVLVANVTNGSGHNFVLDCDQIHLNFDTDSISVESYETATYHDDYYDCECPYIYEDGMLLEALSWYVMYKYLSRGSTHPIYSLKSNVATLNPLLQWNYYRPKAINSVRKKLSTNINDGWNNFFYNSTFLPRG